MSDNPYEAPSQLPGDSSLQGDREQLRRVARSQKNVLYCLLANIGLNIVSFAVQRGGDPEAGPSIATLIVGVFAIGVIVASIYFVYQLTKSMGQQPAIAVILSLCMCIPCVSLIVLLVVNQQATGLLQKNGVKVSLMGADPNSI
jgi:heme/copper-type cytochrome/quinol oxidase subunit 4